MGVSFLRIHVALSGWIVKENGIMGGRESETVARGLRVDSMISQLLRRLQK